MGPVAYDFLSLTLLSAWPVWLATGVLAGGLYWLLPGGGARKALLCLALSFGALSLYAMVGRAGFESWPFASRPDAVDAAQSSAPPILGQTITRLQKDPRDPKAFAAVGDFLATNMGISPDAPVRADQAYRDAERYGALDADTYARWAEILVLTNLDQAEWYEDDLERLLDAALAQDPDHTHAGLLATERLARDQALPRLREVAATMSLSDPFSEVVDDRILMALMGNEPSIAPDLASVSDERVREVLAQGAEETEETEGTGARASGDEPPFMRMVRQLESKVTTADGAFLEPLDDPEFNAALGVDLYRLALVRLTLGQQAEAKLALDRALEILGPSHGLNFWAARHYWSLGDAQAAEASLVAVLAGLSEGSPEWRAANRTLISLREAIGQL